MTASEIFARLPAEIFRPAFWTLSGPQPFRTCDSSTLWLPESTGIAETSAERYSANCAIASLISARLSRISSSQRIRQIAESRPFDAMRTASQTWGPITATSKGVSAFWAVAAPAIRAHTVPNRAPRSADVRLLGATPGIGDTSKPIGSVGAPLSGMPPSPFFAFALSSSPSRLATANVRPLAPRSTTDRKPAERSGSVISVMIGRPSSVLSSESNLSGFMAWNLRREPRSCGRPPEN